MRVTESQQVAEIYGVGTVWNAKALLLESGTVYDVTVESGGSGPIYKGRFQTGFEAIRYAAAQAELEVALEDSTGEALPVALRMLVEACEAEVQRLEQDLEDPYARDDAVARLEAARTDAERLVGEVG